MILLEKRYAVGSRFLLGLSSFVEVLYHYLSAYSCRLPSHSLQVAPIFLAVQPFSYNSIWLVEIYVRDSSKLFLVRAIMKVVRNTVEDVCVVYYCHDTVFCLRCGMALRMSPINKRDKQRLRQLQLRREEEQDRIIRIIKGIKK
jgi:hypothetical protein